MQSIDLGTGVGNTFVALIQTVFVTVVVLVYDVGVGCFCDSCSFYTYCRGWLFL